MCIHTRVLLLCVYVCVYIYIYIYVRIGPPRDAPAAGRAEFLSGRGARCSGGASRPT